MRECDLILGGSYLLAMDDNDTRIRNGGVAIKDGKIIALAEISELRNQYKPKEEIVHENAVILPGLIDAHTHETLTRGLHEDLPLMRWLEEVCYPVEASYTPEDIYAAALMTQMELIRGGVTTFIDIFRYADQAIKVIEKSGMRAIFTPQFFDETSDTLESIDKTVDLIEKYHGSQNGRVSVWFGPHAPYSCGPESYARAAELSKKLGVGVHTHMCETKAEVQLIKERYGKDPVEYLHEAGVLDVPCVLAHSIYLTDENISLLAKKRDTAGLVYNPISNMKIADGIARIPELLSAGCTVGLGTDSNLSNNGLDMFAEMRIGSYLQKVFNDDATIMPCFEMLKLATRGSAKVLKMEDKIGSLEPGKCADVIAVSFSKPHMWPIYYENPSNIVEQIVYSARASDVITTIVDGKVLMDNYVIRTLDEKGAFEFIQKRAMDLYARSFPDRVSSEKI
jgi:5-methylthioadenosine/S-adenosylhomocysteine deaminase